MAKKAVVKKEPKAQAEEIKITKILGKAYLNGLVSMVCLGKKGEFQVKDSNGNILVIYGGSKTEQFKEEIGVFNVGLLLDILKTTEKPDITYEDGVLTIKEGSKTFEYLTADPGVIFTAYNPKPGEHIQAKLKKIDKFTELVLPDEQKAEIMKGMSVLKDTSVVFIENDIFGVGGEHENKYRVQMPGFLAEGRITLPKKELQEILSACEGAVTMEIREGGVPVVVREKDLTYIINQQG
jgi:hypothetical protein